jgi:multiple sugar transport system permease protein
MSLTAPRPAATAHANGARLCVRLDPRKHVARANEWGVFRYIAVPLARPIIGLVGFFAFVASWNNFFLPFVMTYDNSQYPLQIGLQQLIGSTASFNPANYSAGTSVVVLHRPDLAMAAIIAIAPVAIVFMFAQRTLVKGMLAGATKG